MGPFPRSWVEVDLGALRSNLASLRSLSKAPYFYLVVKADAYGHGIVTVGRFGRKCGVDGLAVATITEAVTLRDGGVSGPIMAMSPWLEIEAEQGVFYDIDLFVENEAMINAVSAAARATGKRARVHLKVDTGMHRFGCRPEVAPDLVRLILAKEEIEWAGVANHLADTYTAGTATAQLERFAATIESLPQRPPLVHTLAGAGTLLYHPYHYDLVRVGLVAYGVDPRGLAAQCGLPPLQPLLKWFARVTSVRKIPKGDTVSYGGTWTAERPTRIATVGIGYGDGYPRLCGNRSHVMLHGKPAPVRGTICMDQMLVDVADHPEVQPGDVATLLGPEIPAAQIAEWAETNAHEVLCRVMPRVPRRYVGRDA